MRRILIAFVSAVMFCASADVSLAVYTSASKHLGEQDEWFKSDEAKTLADNIISYQTPYGGWPKELAGAPDRAPSTTRQSSTAPARIPGGANFDTSVGPFKGDVSKLKPTFDNGATTLEMLYLGKIVSITRDEKYKAAFEKGIDYVLKAQYPSGGWPQCYPYPTTGTSQYQRYITYNDGAMIRVMFLLKEIRDNPMYGWLDPSRKVAVAKAFDLGVDCVLKSQTRVNGKLTAWGAQVDPVTFEPMPARAFEPASLSACEIVGILHLLMAIDKPSPDVVASVDAAVEWLNEVKIPGIRVEDVKTENTPRGYERYVIKDPAAPPMWARFYEIGTNRPIFSDRTSQVKYDLSEIEIERRTGYQWLKYWPRNLLEKEYPAWKAKIEGKTPATQPVN